tara:strand:+ start:413 stop:1429 length:1017 start_codon:yes stop_codon:yes gene_type:complete
MKRAILLSAATCAVLSLPTVALSSILDEVSLANTPKEGSTFTKTLVSELNMELVDMDLRVLLNGEEQDVGANDIEIKITSSDSFTMSESILGMDGDRITGVSRKYEELASAQGQDFTGPDGESQSDDKEKESLLEGKTITFKWDAEDDSWGAAWGEDEDGDAELLEDLEADSSLGWLLPGNPIEVGGSWELGVDEFNRTMDPFGKLHWEEKDPEQELFNEAFEEGLDVSEFTATLKSVEDGVATITFVVEAATSFEMTPELGDEAPEGFEMSNSFEFGFELEGTLTWNMEAHHAIALSIEGDVIREDTMEQSGSGEMEFEVTQIQSFEGTYSLELTIE